MFRRPTTTRGLCRRDPSPFRLTIQTNASRGVGGVGFNHNERAVRAPSAAEAAQPGSDQASPRRSVRAGGVAAMPWLDHDDQAVPVRSGLRAGSITYNHSERVVRVRSGLRAGSVSYNHSERAVLFCSGVRAGGAQTLPR